MAEKTKEQASAVSEAVVSSVNTVATKTVEEAENIVVTAGVVRKVSLAHVLSLGSLQQETLLGVWGRSVRRCLTLQAALIVCVGATWCLYNCSYLEFFPHPWIGDSGIRFMHKHSNHAQPITFGT